MLGRARRTLLVTLGLVCRSVRVNIARSKTSNSSSETLDGNTQTELVPCDASTLPSRSRSQWCEQEGVVDQHISFEQIQEGYGLCLDAQCYDARSLQTWLQHNELLPHNRAAFTLVALRDLMRRRRVPGFLAEGQPPSGPTAVSVAFGSLGRILTGSSDGLVQLWDTEAIVMEVARYEGHHGVVNSVQFSPDGHEILSAGRDATVRLWNKVSTQEVCRFVGHAEEVISAVFSADGTRVLTGGLDGTVRLWDLVGRELKLLEVDEPVRAITFLPDSSSQSLINLRGKPLVWDAQTETSEAALGGVSFAVHSPDGSRFLSIKNGVAQIWDAMAQIELLRLSANAEQFTSAVFSPDSSVIWTGSDDFTARLWDAFTGVELNVFLDFRSDVASVAFSPDSLNVAMIQVYEEFARVFKVRD